MSAAQSLVVTVEGDDSIRYHPPVEPAATNLVHAFVDSDQLAIDFSLALAAARALAEGTTDLDVHHMWRRQLRDAVSRMSASEELQAALTVVLTPDDDGTARALSDALDEAQDTVNGQRLHRAGLDDEPDRDGHLADLGERPALTGGAS